jgi:hypothetical protein
MDNIKFGTDGWRSVIADGFTVGNVQGFQGLQPGGW